MKRLAQIMALLVFASGAALPALGEDVLPVIVGRVTDAESGLLRYVPEENDWVATVRDVPFAAGDTFYAGSEGRAELMAPNGSRVRIGGATQIQFLALDPEFSEADIAAGTARFFNNGTDTVVRADSPFGYVLSSPGSAFDFYVGRDSAEVVAIKGTVNFVHTGTNTRYDVSAGYPSVLADRFGVASGEGAPDPDWDSWNAARDSFWATRARPRGVSAQYLPPALSNDAYVLEENGQWVQLRYDGRPCWFWKPTRVDAGWAPFTEGRWTEWYGDQTWIPAEPFGYVTHHYGNWVLVGNQWYWAPPVARPGLPLMQVDLAWYPGRVSWIYRDGYVGWVPLAPHETYYCHHGWGGRRAVVIRDDRSAERIHVDLRRYAYAGHAVVVPQASLYRVGNYGRARVTGTASAAAIGTYRAAPVINRTVVDNYPNIRQRYDYSTQAVREKPQASAANRIRQNEQIARDGRRESPATIDRQLRSVPRGDVDRQTRVEGPRAADRVGPVPEARRVRPESEPRQQEGKTAGPQTWIRRGGQGHTEPGQTGQAPSAGPLAPGTHPSEQTRRPQSPERRPEANPQAGREAPSIPRAQGVTAPRQAQGAPAAPTETSAPKLQGVRPADQAQPFQGTSRRPEASPQAGREATPQPRPEGVTPARPAQVTAPAAPASPSRPLAQTPQTGPSRGQTQHPQAVERRPEANPQAGREAPSIPRAQGVTAPRQAQGAPAAPTETSAPKLQGVRPVSPAQLPGDSSHRPDANARIRKEGPARETQGVAPARPAQAPPSAQSRQAAPSNQAKQGNDGSGEQKQKEREEGRK